MTPPDLPPRPVPRAPLTDVVPKRTLVIIAVAVALVVLGVVLALVFGDDGDSKASANGGGGKTSAGASASADTRTDEKDGTRADGEKSASATTGSGSGAGAETGKTPSAQASATGGSGGEAGGDSKVASTYKGSQGYSIGLPEGWKFQSSGSAGDRFTGPDGQKLLVAWTSTPKGDPVTDWKNQEQGMVRSQYKRVRIEEVNYRGWNTADWEFTYVEGGTKYRTIDRGFVVNDHLGHALMYTAKASNWDSELRKDAWNTLTESFKPKS
ncbi:serine/threonine protein kinase [Streptomyces muensis]